MQYYGRLLTGDSRRLSLIYHRLGFESLEHWRASDPRMVALLARCIRVAAVQVAKRHWAYVTGLPWILFALADDRRDDRINIGKTFLDIKDECCVPIGMPKEENNGAGE